MRIAIVICGNLRTFLMPTRENDKLRLCDSFVKNIVSNNNADVFAYTDTNDFYFDNTQYFGTERKIEILNNDTSRLHNNIDFINNNAARNIIFEQVKLSIGDNLMYLTVEDPFDATTDAKFQQLKNIGATGNNPILLLQQVRKMKLAYEQLKKYEDENNFKYDIILKWRFDNEINGLLNLKEYDYIENDIYVPGVHSPIIYDWFAHGNRNAMDFYLSLYDFIGNFLNEGRVYACDHCDFCGDINQHVSSHQKTLFEITLSVEYHLFRVLKINNIKLSNTKYSSGPYRYRNEYGIHIDSIMKNLNIDATVVSYCPGIDINMKQYKKI